MNWKETLEFKNELEKELKDRSMIYQVYYKEKAAILFGFPVATYHHFPYELWKHVRSRMSNFYDCMSRDYQEVSNWSGKDLSKVPYCNWVDLYREWLSVQ